MCVFHCAIWLKVTTEKTHLGLLFLAGTYSVNRQGVISTPKHKIFGEMIDTQFNLVRFSVAVESKGKFHKFYSYKTIGTLKDVRKQTYLAVSIYKVVMIILVNWVTDLWPPKFHKSSILTPCFQILGKTMELPSESWYNRVAWLTQT